jgi:CheY-like chemotaxis protein
MKTVKILLVDDVTLFLEIEKSFLRSKPVTVLTAKNGEEALEVMRRERPDLVFLDMHMPKMDGVVCCSRIKEDPELRRTPVIIVTTAGAESDMEICRQVGCDDYLTKPVDRRAFIEKVCRYVPAVDRREPRVACAVPVEYRNGERKPGIAEDISMGGMYVATEGDPGGASTVTLFFSVPGNAPKSVEIKGRVAWRNYGENRPRQSAPAGFGVEFTSLDLQTLQSIKDLISSLMGARRGSSNGNRNSTPPV